MKTPIIKGNIIKSWLCSIDESFYENENVPKRKPSGPMLKWFQVNMSLDDKARLNMLTYPEYLEWCNEQVKKQQEEAMKEQEAAEEKVTGKTFWANDTGKRDNVSANEYADFLAKNGVNVANSSTINFDELSKQYNK